LYTICFVNWQAIGDVPKTGFGFVRPLAFIAVLAVPLY
jgi:hypothetical protein